MENNKTSDNVFADAFRRHREVLEASSVSLLLDIQKGAELLTTTLLSGGRALTCGNGGSATDAIHLSGEFLCRYREDRKPFPVTALVTDVAMLTATGNDYSFEDIFARQVDALGTKGDILIAFTTSGASKNVLKALEAARAKAMRVIVLTGAKGESLRSRADVLVAVPSEETARVQEMHELVYHAWCEYFDSEFKAAQRTL